MDTKRTWSLLAGLAALAALIVQVAVPFVHWQDGTRDGVLFASEIGDVVGTQVPGAQFGLMLGATIALALGGLAVALATFVPRAGPWLLGLGGVVASAGGAVAIQANALWTGRGLSTALHAILGTDTPSSEMMELAASPADFPTQVWAIGAPIVVLLVAFALVATWRAWALHAAKKRDLRKMAFQHARAGTWAMATLVIALIVPWSMQTLEDGTTPPDGQEQDTDAFLWSPYDILRIHMETEATAQESREAALIQYEGLALLLRSVAGAGIIAVIGAAIAVAGTHVATHGQVVWGRLLENSAFLTTMALAFLALAAFLGAFWLYDAGDILDSGITGAPLLLLAGAVPGLWASGRVVAALVQEDNDPVADDFPEPVVYD